MGAELRARKEKGVGGIPIRLRKGLNKILLYSLVFIFVIAVVAPFLWMTISSISPQVELTTKPPHWFPETPTLIRFAALIFGSDTGKSMPVATERFVSALLNSIVVSITTTILCIAAGVSAAYALARLPVPGERHFLIGMLGAQMLPRIVIIIPLFFQMKAINLIDTRIGLIIIYSGFMLPTVIWIMHSYFQTIPMDLEEAAMIDGCSRFSALIRIILPLSGPGIVAVAAFTFLSSWNEFFISLIMTTSQAKTITVIITEFATQFGVDYGLMATGGVIGSIPPILLAFSLQRYIVKGLTSGAVKG